MRTLPAVVVMVLAVAGPLQAQAPPPIDTIRLSGPRFGVTLLSGGVRDTLTERGMPLRSPVTQFGWQFEKIFYAPVQPGPTLVSEWVVLAAGLEQGVMLPSITWLVGLRTMGGTEFGLGPNVTPAGAALALAAGKSFQVGAVHVPVNVAVVPSRSGVRVSLLTGFTLRR